MSLKKLAGGGAAFAITAFAATTAFALAGDPKPGTYEVTGVTISHSAACAPIAAGLPPNGSPSLAHVTYKGPSKPGTQTFAPATGPAGPATTSSCLATANVPATGLNGATVNTDCSQDTLSGPAAPGHYTIHYTVAATAIPTSWTVTQVLDLSSVVPGCTLTTGGTWAAE